MWLECNNNGRGEKGERGLGPQSYVKYFEFYPNDIESHWKILGIGGMICYVLKNVNVAIYSGQDMEAI